MTTRRTVISSAALLTLPNALLAQGAAFPDRAVRLVVPNPPGGPSDILGRLLAESMRTTLGQAVLVDNRPGAAGMVGTAAVASAPADGYTVLVTSRSNHVIAPLVQKSVQTDPQRDLAPVGLAIRAVGMLATPVKSSFKSLRELVAFAKANPGKLFYGSAGIGATNHIAIEQFKRLAGVAITHVPYKGSGPLISGLMGGEVALALLDFSSAHAGMKAGLIIPLAQTASRRLVTLQEVPTLAESGFKNFDPSFWIGLAVPKGTPVSVVERLNGAMNAALSDTQMKARAQVNGWQLVGGVPQALSATVAADMSVYPGLVSDLDLKPT